MEVFTSDFLTIGSIHARHHECKVHRRFTGGLSSRSFAPLEASVLDALPGPCKSRLHLSAEEFIRPAHWKLLLPNQFRLRWRLGRKSRRVVPRTILKA